MGEGNVFISEKVQIRGAAGIRKQNMPVGVREAGGTGGTCQAEKTV